MQPATSDRAIRLGTLIVIAFAATMWMSPAHAYLDPTTGSILLQGLLAGVAGATVVLRLYWTKIKTFFRRFAGNP
jgi:hypothetical protein